MHSVESDPRSAALRVPLASSSSSARTSLVVGASCSAAVARSPADRSTRSSSSRSRRRSSAFISALVAHRAAADSRSRSRRAARVARRLRRARRAIRASPTSEVLRVGSMFNILLDGLAADRARMRALAAEVIAAGDRERAALARELHDSTAQHLAALLLQLSAAARDCDGSGRSPSVCARRAMRPRAILEEVRRCRTSCIRRARRPRSRGGASQAGARRVATGTAIDIDVSARHARGASAARTSRPCCTASRRKRFATRRRHASPRDESASSVPADAVDGDAGGARRRRGFDLAEADGAAFGDGSHCRCRARWLWSTAGSRSRPRREAERPSRRPCHSTPRPSWLHSKRSMTGRSDSRHPRRRPRGRARRACAPCSARRRTSR